MTVTVRVTASDKMCAIILTLYFLTYRNEKNWTNPSLFSVCKPS